MSMIGGSSRTARACRHLAAPRIRGLAAPLVGAALLLPPLVGAAFLLGSPTGSSRELRADRVRLSTPARCEALGGAARRGKLLFHEGTTAAGRPLVGWLHGGTVTLTGRDAACAGCHGRAGAGAVEGTIAAPALTPDRLFEPAAQGYTDAKLAIALRDGRAQDGRALRPPMPQFRLDEGDRDDLLAYLRCVGREPAPGVTDASVRVGAALPLSGPRAALGTAVRDALTAGFLEADARGGVLRRRVELVVEDSGALGDAEATARLLDAGILALVGTMAAPGAARGAGTGEGEVPLVAPLAMPPERLDDPAARAFYVFPGPESLARAAVIHASRAGVPPALLVAHGDDDAGERWRRGALVEASLRTGPPATFAFVAGRLKPGPLAAAARAASADALLVAGAPADLRAAVAALDRLPNTRLYAPASMLGGMTAIGGTARARVLLLHPGLPEPLLGAAFAELRGLVQRHGFTARHLAYQASAVAGARVVVEALRRAGDPPTREGLVAALESFRDVETGLVPPLSFSRYRRTGVLGAHVVRTGPSGELVPEGAWIGLTP